jgi:hypothetical protein
MNLTSRVMLSIRELRRFSDELLEAEWGARIAVIRCGTVLTCRRP